MKDLVILLYSFAFIAQAGATIFAIAAFRLAGRYRFGWIILALGLLIMLGRRLNPLLIIQETGTYNVLDASLATIISLLLLVGVFSISKLVQDWQMQSLQLTKLLSQDFLTQVMSKSEIIKKGEIEIDRCKRSGHTLAVLELDIDHFKRVNDEYGHQAGDDILKGLAQHCDDILREIDLFGRIGGEEFLAILPETNVEQAFEVAERLRKNISNCTYKTRCNQHLKITVSIGITIYSPKDEPLIKLTNSEILEKLMENADKAMYQAKAAGRNKVATH